MYAIKNPIRLTVSEIAKKIEFIDLSDVSEVTPIKRISIYVMLVNYIKRNF